MTLSYSSRCLRMSKLCASTRFCALPIAEVRSEEHTSELQSQFHLVCRLLLEEKKLHGRGAVFRAFVRLAPRQEEAAVRPFPRVAALVAPHLRQPRPLRIFSRAVPCRATGPPP